MADQPQEGSNVGSSRVTMFNNIGSRRANSRSTSSPCGACKYMRKKCADMCILAPYFSHSDQGLEEFALVHKVFGAYNVSKMLKSVEVDDHHKVVYSLLYEARARLKDPILGCLSTILALEQQVAYLKRKLANVVVPGRQINVSTSYATLLQSTQQQQQPLPQPNINLPVQPPPYYNNSPLYPNLMNMSSFNSSFDHPSMQTAPSAHNLELLQFSGLPQYEEQSMNPQGFNNDINSPVQLPFYNNSSSYTNLTNMSGFNSSFDHPAVLTAPSTHNLEPLQFSRLPQHEEQSMILQGFNNDINPPVQPPFYNNSSPYTNLMNMSGFNSSFDHPAMQTAPSAHNLEPLQFSRLPQHEEQSMILQGFNNDINPPVQPPFYNNSPPYTNLMNVGGFNSSFDHPAMQTTPSAYNLEPLQFSGSPQHEEQSMIPQAFNNDINPPVQPPFYNNSSPYTNLMNMSSFNSSFDQSAMQTAPSAHSLEPLPFSGWPQHEEEYNIPQAFNNDIAYFLLPRRVIFFLVLLNKFIFDIILS